MGVLLALVSVDCKEYFFEYFIYSLVLPQQHKPTTIFLDQLCF